MYAGFWWVNLRERNHLEDLGVVGKIILKYISKKLEGGMDWIYLAQDRAKRRGFVNAIMNLRVS